MSKPNPSMKLLLRQSPDFARVRGRSRSDGTTVLDIEIREPYDDPLDFIPACGTPAGGSDESE